MDLGSRLATARASAGKHTATLRDKLHPRQSEGTLVPSVESDGWLEETAKGAGRPAVGHQVTEKWTPRLSGPLTHYVVRACEIGSAMGRRREKVDAAPSVTAPASAVALIAARSTQPPAARVQPPAASQRRVSTPPPPPPPRRSRLGEELPYLDALPTPSPGPRAPAAAAQGGQARAPRHAAGETRSLATPWLETSRPPQNALRPEHAQQLREAQQRLHEALARAHKQELLKAEAQMRARHAEQWIAQFTQPSLPLPLPPNRRSWQRQNVSAILVFCIAAFVVGSFLSLLLPMRKRVLLQENALHELGESHQYLTRQNEALMQQLSGQPEIDAP